MVVEMFLAALKGVLMLGMVIGILVIVAVVAYLAFWFAVWLLFLIILATEKIKKMCKKEEW